MSNHIKKRLNQKKKNFKKKNVNWSSKNLFYRTDSRNRPERTVLAERTNPTMPHLISDYLSNTMTGGLNISSLKPHSEPGHFSRHTGVTTK